MNQVSAQQKESAAQSAGADRPSLFSAGWRHRLLVTATAMLAFAAACFFFAPRFAYWGSIGVPQAIQLPEVNRAYDALLQLEHPLSCTIRPSNLVIKWRLLFPALGHGLALPAWLYLCLPHIGCLVLLGYCAHLLRRNQGSWTASCGATFLLATCSWFFVSTGWLAYFDAWYLLGLLVVVFARSERRLVIVTLLAPWIDERFVLTLPLCLLLREHQRGLQPEPAAGPTARRSVLLALVALVPWLLFRATVYWSHTDAVTRSYLDLMITRKHGQPWWIYPAGLWHGLRWAWIFVAALLLLLWRDSRPRAGWALVLVAGTLAVNLAIVDDLSRTTSILLPVVFAGMLAWQKKSPIWSARALVLCCALNAVFPAKHIVGDWDVPIRYLYAEVDRSESLADVVNGQGLKLISSNAVDEAIGMFSWAIKLNSRMAGPYANRAVLYFNTGKIPEALRDADAAVALEPKNPEFLANRGRMRIATGQVVDAIVDLNDALRNAEPTWPGRAFVQKLLDSARSR